MPGLRAVDEGAVPASALATSRLFVLPVASRRWVLTDNTLFEHEQLLFYIVGSYLFSIISLSEDEPIRLALVVWVG